MDQTPKKPRKPRGVASLFPNKCIACGARCQSACPTNAIEMTEKGEPIILVPNCIGCQKCVKVCPVQALGMHYTPAELELLKQWEQERSGQPGSPDDEDPVIKKLASYRGVWVFVESSLGQAATVSWELLGTGRRLAASLACELSAVVIGHGTRELCEESFAFGADKVYTIDAKVFENYRTSTFLDALEYLILKHKPEIVLVGATGLGRDLAGAVATRLKTGLTADCTGLDVDEKRNLLQTRPAFGGNIMATILCEETRPQMATVRPHVLAMPRREPGRTGILATEAFDLAEESVLVKVLEIIDDADSKNRIDIAGANLIVSGGRGMMGAENFRILQELADVMGGVVAGSRSSIDAGWLPYERQVGQTGKTVRPKVYIACGISGAIQHLVGMQDSDLIIAINRDRDAPIFEVATYGIVGDLFQIVPALTQKVREWKAQKRGADPAAGGAA